MRHSQFRVRKRKSWKCDRVTDGGKHLLKCPLERREGSAHEETSFRSRPYSGFPGTGGTHLKRLHDLSPFPFPLVIAQQQMRDSQSDLSWHPILLDTVWVIAMVETVLLRSLLERDFLF